MDDVLYFQKKFLQALNVPVSRLNSDALYSIGRATEITRDELKFTRFIIRLRARFSHLFIEMLKKQLILKGIITLDDWETIQNDVKFDFAKDNYFSELKDSEISQGRLQLAAGFQQFSGKYYSHTWIRKNILRQTDENIDEQDQYIEKEIQSQEPRWINPIIDQNQQTVLQTQQMLQQQQQQPQETPPEENQDPKIEEVRNAMIFVDQMKQRGPRNRTTQEQSKYKAAVQVVAKNPEIVQQLGNFKRDSNQ